MANRTEARSPRPSTARDLPARAYHLTLATNWPSVERNGLLSTRALLDLVGVGGEERERIERRHRPAPIRLASGVTINDQRPMPPTALERCLAPGTPPEEWYALLNRRVFFWFDVGRLNRQRAAGQEAAHVVLTVDAARLLDRYGGRAALTPINTGAAIRRPAPRGPRSFVPYDEWLRSGWLTETVALGTRPRPRSHPPAELAIADAVPDVLRFVVEVHRLEPHESFRP